MNSLKAAHSTLTRTLLTALAIVGSSMLLHAQSLPTAPSEWTHTASTSASTTSGQNFNPLPSITVPAVSGAKHVVDCISFATGFFNNGGISFLVILEDGAAGSTPLLQWQINGTTAQTVNLCGLSVVGTAGNAMTFRFAGTPGTNPIFLPSFGSLNLVGHDAQ
jgi:hypothetical protein